MEFTVISQVEGNIITPLQWRHNGREIVSNRQPRDCLLNRLFRRRSKKTSKLRVTGLCAENSPGTGEFPAQMSSNAENVSIWRRHHADALLSLPNRASPRQNTYLHHLEHLYIQRALKFFYMYWKNNIIFISKLGTHIYPSMLNIRSSAYHECVTIVATSAWFLKRF